MAQYTFPLASIPGATGPDGFTGQMSDHAKGLILANLPEAGTAEEVNLQTDGVNLIVECNELTAPQQATLEDLVERAAEYFIVTQDGGVTDLGEPSEAICSVNPLSLPPNPPPTRVITLQLKRGDGEDSVGHGEVFTFIPSGLMPIDKSGGTLSAAGKLSFTIGATLSRGAVSIVIQSGTLPVRNLTARWV